MSTLSRSHTPAPTPTPSCPSISAATLLTLQVTPNHTTNFTFHPCTAVGMSTSSMCLRTRSSSAPSTATAPKAIRSGSYKYFNRGASAAAADDDYRVPHAHKLKLRPVDKLLKKFRYKEALDAALAGQQPVVVCRCGISCTVWLTGTTPHCSAASWRSCRRVMASTSRLPDEMKPTWSRFSTSFANTSQTPALQVPFVTPRHNRQPVMFCRAVDRRLQRVVRPVHRVTSAPSSSLKLVISSPHINAAACSASRPRWTICSSVSTTGCRRRCKYSGVSCRCAPSTLSRACVTWLSQMQGSLELLMAAASR